MKNSFGLLGIAFLQFCFTPAAQAMDTAFEYACLGIDGIPISKGSSLESSCCRDGQLIQGAPANCRAGFNSIGAGAAAGGAFGVNLAQKTLDIAKGMSGASVVYGTPTPSEQGHGPREGASTNALTSSGSGSSGDGTGSSGVTGSGAGDGAGGNSSGRGGSGGGNGGAGGVGLGTSAGMSASTKSGNGDEAAGPNSAGGYGKAGGAGGESDKNALSGINFGNLFGKDGAGGKGTGDGLTELNFGGEGSDGAKDAAGELSGSASDPADYFNRIDKTASLFKIVSNRYSKETVKKHVGAPENKLEKGAQ